MIKIFRKKGELRKEKTLSAGGGRQVMPPPYGRENGIERIMMNNNTINYIFPDDMSLLSFEEEQLYFKRLEEGDKETKKVLVEHNMKLVHSIANQYQSIYEDTEDLIQAGVFGLIRAIDKFDYHRGLKFSTYAVHWIRQSVQREITNSGRTIRLPVHVQEKISKIRKFKEDYFGKYGTEPDVREISAALGMDSLSVVSLIDKTKRTISLNKVVGEDETELIEFFESDMPKLEDDVEKEYLIERVRQAVNSLPPRESMIIKLRFGLDDRERHTLEQIGKIFNLTRERIRQIESSALRTMRSYLRDLAA